MVTITLYTKHKKRHKCTEQTFRLCGRRRGWDVLRELHWNGEGDGRGDWDGEHM